MYPSKMRGVLELQCIAYALKDHKHYVKWLLTQTRKTTNEPWHEISNNVVCATSKSSDQPAHTDQSLC